MANSRRKSATGVTETQFGEDSLVKTSSNAEAARNLDSRRNAIKKTATIPNANSRPGKSAGSKVGGATQISGGAV